MNEGDLMNIAHYALGFPPFRRGGMVKYYIDLMKMQVQMGHKTSFLWPGQLKDFSDNLTIKKRSNYKFDGSNIEVGNYEIINPLPIPLLDGIKDFREYTQQKEIKTIYNFFQKNSINVFHVHTLMGLPAEFIDVCNELGIKTVYTTHDYFGLCPKWGLEINGRPCVDDHGCTDCVLCNEAALSLSKVKFLQSNTYKVIKEAWPVKILRRKHNTKRNKENEFRKNIDINIDELAIEYRHLRKFYIEILEKFDVLHFNSKNTLKVYDKYFDAKRTGVVLNITHGSILDQRQIRNSKLPIRFGYLGPITKHKGFFYLKTVCDELYNEIGGSFELHIFAEYSDESIYLKKHRPYQYSELDNVMKQFDVLIVPSLWNETFGLTVLEAIAFAIPVIVTENVGAKDLIVNNKNGIIIEPLKNCLKKLIKNLISDPSRIDKMNRYLCEDYELETMSVHARKLIQLYQER